MYHHATMSVRTPQLLPPHYLPPDPEPLRDLWGHHCGLLVCRVHQRLHHCPVRLQATIPQPQDRGDPDLAG